MISPHINTMRRAAVPLSLLAKVAICCGTLSHRTMPKGTTGCLPLYTTGLTDVCAFQSLDRCATVDDALTHLARTYPHTKFLRARAGAIGFASGQSSKPNLVNVSTSLSYSRVPSLGVIPQRSRIQEKDEFFDEEEDEKEKASDDDDSEEDDDQWEDDAVDTDVLPTVLVYRGGDLVHSWIRVDWEAKQGIEELLKRCAY